MLPVFRRAFIDPLLAIKSRSPRYRYWKYLEKTQYLPEEELLKIQWKRLKTLLIFSYENNKYYRELFDRIGAKPNDIYEPADLKKLPILRKSDIQSNAEKMITKGYTPSRLLKFKTGGSTGTSLELYITEECSELRNACARRHDRWSGWEVGEPVGALWGNPVLPTDLKSKFKNRVITPFIYLDTMRISDETVMKFVWEWRRIRPTILFGHAHSIYIFARFLEKMGIREVRPKGIISTSMMLLPSERAFIEKNIGVKVYDRYGCEEVSLIASECERHEGMHLNVEHLFVEFLKEDGSDASEGELGKIIVTDLMNRAMPFIRYQVEDVGVPTKQKCSCGRGLPLMNSLTGRIADFLVHRDGSMVAGISLIENTLTAISGIVQMQIIQEDIDTIQLKVVVTDAFDSDNRSRLIAYFESLFGKGTSVKIVILPEILPEKSGKYRFSICKIPNC